MHILIDSGFRRGTDIVKALALGAEGVLMGRPAAFAVAAGGEAGVTSHRPDQGRDRPHDRLSRLHRHRPARP